MRNSLLDDTVIDGRAELGDTSVVRAAPPASATLADTPEPQLLTLSAGNPAALVVSARGCLDWLMACGPDMLPGLRQLAGAMARRHEHHAHRLAIVADNREDFCSKLRAFVAGETARGMVTGGTSPAQNPGIVFVFTGMGPRWESFGGGLLASEPAFRKAVEQADAALERHSGWSLLSRLDAGLVATPAALHEMAQPINFVLQLGLAALWRSWGIEPAAIVGHSVGEVAAAHLAGALSLDDAARIVHHLGRIGPLLPPGGMLATRLTPEAADKLQQDLNSLVTVAAVNSPCSVVLAGAPDALADVAERLRSDNIFSRWLAVDLAFHTPHMDHLKNEVFTALAGLRPSVPAIPLYSTVTAGRVDEAAHDAGYWWDNLRRPVQFAATMQRMVDDGLTLFLENSPRPLLASSIRECLADRGVAPDVLTSLVRGRPERTTVLEALGTLYCRGYPVAWKALYPAAADGGGPALPWQDTGEHADTQVEVPALQPEAGHHTLLGRRIAAPNPTWETTLDAGTMARVWGATIADTTAFPRAGFVEAALAVGQASGTARAGALEGLEFCKPLVLADNERRTLRLELSGKTGDLAIYSSDAAAGDDQGAEWTLHATTRLSAHARPACSVPQDLAAIRARCSEITRTAGLCQTVTAHRHRQDPASWPVRRIWQGQREILAELGGDNANADARDQACPNPALLEAAFRAVAMTLPDRSGAGPCVPVAIAQVVQHGWRHPEGRLWCHGRLVRQTDLAFESDLTLCDDGGWVLTEIRGLRCQFSSGQARHEAAERIRESLYTCVWQQCDAPAGTRAKAGDPGRWLILTDGNGDGSLLAEQLEKLGADCSKVSIGRRLGFSGLDTLVRAPDIDLYSGIIYLAGISAAPGSNDPASLDPCRPVLALAQWLAQRNTTLEPGAAGPRLVIATAGVHDVDGTEAGAEDPRMPSQASIWGLGRVIMRMHPGLRCTLVDLGTADAASGWPLLARDLTAGVTEQEIAYRGSARFIHRLVRTTPNAASRSTAPIVMPTTAPLALQVPQPGVLRKIRFRETHRRPPGPGEVELQIQAIGLNFKDVLKIMGWLPASVQEGTFFGAGLGMEAAATVMRVGHDVRDLRPGDQIIAMPRGGCLQSYVTMKLDQLFWVPRLAGSTLCEQAGMPVVFVTAYYGLHQLARVQPGEKVLLHSATGGVGLAAIQVARWLGAEIFATAGSPEKRAYLRSLGIQHVMDSRSLAFADEIMALTEGKGVDVVLNFLSGEALEKSVSVLAPFGRLIELGKRDMDENNALPLRAFNRSLTFSAVDLDRLAMLHPDKLREVLRAVWQGAEQGQFQPIHTQVYPIGQIADASRTMLKAKHTGKIVLQLHDQTVPVLPVGPAVPRFQDNATYLVSGVSGGLAREIVRWLVRDGARSVVLVKPHAHILMEIRSILGDLESQGARVLVAACDLSDAQEAAALIARIEDTMPPLRGIVHAALTGTTDIMSDQSAACVGRTVTPDVAAAWNLHQATQNIDLDVFITLSSAAGLLGNPGQAVKAATGCFLDGLSRHRVALGLPASSLGLSDLAGAGVSLVDYATPPGDGDAQAGLGPEEIIEALTLVADAKPVQIGVMEVNWSRYG